MMVLKVSCYLVIQHSKLEVIQALVRALDLVRGWGHSFFMFMEMVTCGLGSIYQHNGPFYQRFFFTTNPREPKESI